MGNSKSVIDMNRSIRLSLLSFAQRLSGFQMFVKGLPSGWWRTN